MEEPTVYKELRIHDFRLFAEQNIILGKYITVLAGRNSTGKSTILGMLGNSSEIKKKDGTTYTGGQFRAEFSEIFKGSRAFDVSKSNRFELIMSDDGESVSEQCFFRTSWQKYSTDEDSPERFRIIPCRTIDGKKTEAKMEYPVLYLGLSRLFPIGESNDSNINQEHIKFSSEEHEKWFLEKYVHILSLLDTVNQVTNFSIGETDKKKGVGINTDKYDYLTNSSGQDNLGQILLALLSFKRLRENSGDKWRGGLLLIDEIESTLHPSAQARLLDVLLQEARSTGVQIVFTTHSLSLLKNICKKTEHNNSAVNNGVELYYLTNANRKLEVKRNVDYFAIECDLLVQSIVQNGHKIRVYTEDAEARWVLLHLVQPYTAYLNILDVNVGCHSLMSLYSADTAYFGNSIIVLDGDVTDKTLSVVPEKVREHFKNIIKLPGSSRPEQVMYEYLLSLPSEHDFWSQAGAGLNWTYFKENGPDSAAYQSEKERDRYKKWFIDHEKLFDAYHLFDYWINDNSDAVTTFLNCFVSAYNAVAERVLVPLIPKS